MDKIKQEIVQLKAKAKSIDPFGLLTVEFNFDIEDVDPDLFNSENIQITLIPAEE